jgi:hypothetical protein
MEIGPASQNIKKKQEVNVTSTKLRHDQHKIMKKTENATNLLSWVHSVSQYQPPQQLVHPFPIQQDK